MAADNRLMTVYYVLLGLALILFFSLLNNSRDRDRRSREAQRRDDAQHEDVNIFLNNLGGIIDEWDKEK